MTTGQQDFFLLLNFYWKKMGGLSEMYLSAWLYTILVFQIGFNLT